MEAAPQESRLRAATAPLLVAAAVVLLVGSLLTLRIESHEAGLPWGWLAFGFGAQAIFSLRFLVQWLASERARRTVVPVSFWWLSLLGGLSLGIYFIRRGDPVGMLSQLVPVAIYLRNLWLIHREHVDPAPLAGSAAGHGPEEAPRGGDGA